MSAAIGIDLGTTRSVVAVMGAYGPQVLAVDAPPIGERPGDPHGHAVTVLARLKRETEVLRGEDPDDAVLAVPAFYGPDQRVALRKAAERAGFRVLRQVDAPVATAVAHGWARGGAPEVVAVLDVGPAYVSAAVVELGEARTGVWAVSGRIVAGGGDPGVVAVDVLVSVLRSVGWRVGDVDEVLLTGNGWGAVLPETIAGLGGRSVDARSTPAAGGAVLLAAMMRGDIGGWLPEDASPRLPVRQGVVHPREDGLRKAALRLAADIRWARGDDLGQLPAEVRNRLDALETACATWNPAFEGGDPGPVAAAHERLAVAYERLQAAEAAPAPQRDAAASAASPVAPYASAPVAPYASAPVAPYASAPVAPYASAPAAPYAVAPVRSIVVDAVRAQEAVALPQSRPAGPAKAVREVKVVLLGDGAAGKTSLAAALCGEAFAHRDATHGVEVRELAVGDGLVLRLWDFGGQAIYRSTHQFFHSADAVYLVVWSAREAHRQDVVRDWLRRLRGRLGDSARVLVVATHCDQFEAEVDDRLAEEYPGLLAGQFAVDNASGNGIGEVRAVLAREAAGLAGEPWPESWRAVRDALTGLRREEPQIPFERLAALGREHGVADAEGLAVALHRAGHVLFHHDDDVLRDVVVLDPEWLSRTIADVVGDPGVRRQHGVLEHARLAEIWRPALAGRRLPAPYLLRLMERFDLSYRLDEHRSLIPQLLPGRAPELPWTGDDWPGPGERALHCRFRFREPVDGLMAALTVRLHAYSRGLHWRQGAFLQYPNPAERSSALLLLRGERELTLEVRGASPELLFHSVIGAVEEYLTSRWPNVRYQRDTDPVPAVAGLMERRFDRLEQVLGLVLAFTTKEIPDCPRLFTITRAEAAGLARAALHRDTFRLTLWCEAPGRWHPHWPTEFRQTKEWAIRLQRYAGFVYRTLRQVVPVAGAVVGVVVHDPAVLERIGKELALVQALMVDLPAGADGSPSLPGPEEQREAREFLLAHCPPGFGGLRRVAVATGEYLWLCPEHQAAVDPGLPRVG